MSRRILFSLAAAFLLVAAFLALVKRNVLAGTTMSPSEEPTQPTTTWCVRPGGTPPTCYPSIQQAINLASAGDTISVGVGTYNEFITVTKNLKLIGRGWGNTIIDGAHAQNRPIIQFWGVIDASTLISGFEITGGGPVISSTSGRNGGGIAIEYTSPVIQNTWIHDCVAYKGGGMFVSYGSPVLINVPIWSNQAYQRGGGLFSQASNLRITGDLFDLLSASIWWNQAGWDGGGMFVTSSTLVMSGTHVYWNSADTGAGLGIEKNDQKSIQIFFNDISANTAEKQGGGINVYDSLNLDINANLINDNIISNPGVGGGGLFFLNAQGQVQYNLISGNNAGDTSTTGGGIMIWENTRGLSVHNNIIQLNKAGDGGGIGMFTGAAPLIDSNAILTNTAGIGAGIYMYQGDVFSITNNVIARNIIPSGPGGSAGGVAIVETPVRFINNTVADNAKDGVVLITAEGAVVVNNIIVNSAEDGLENYVINPTVNYTADYNDVFNNHQNYNNILVDHSNDRGVNPMFVGSGVDLFQYYHIQTASPVASTGTNNPAPFYDMDHQVRLLGNNSMGADKPGIQYSIYLPSVFKNLTP